MDKSLKTSKQIHKILVPFDFSSCSENALSEALNIAKGSDTHVELIHVITPVYITDTTSNGFIPSDDSFYRALMKKAEAKMKTVLEKITKPKTVKISVKTSLNSVYAGVLNQAKKSNPDLIIMGTHGASGIKEFFAGSNAYRVVSEAKCPVITIQKKSIKKESKTIILPVREGINPQKKVEFMLKLKNSMSINIIIVGFASSQKEKPIVKASMERVKNNLEKALIQTKSIILNGNNFAKGILDFAKKNKADLIAITKNQNFSLDQLFKGPYAQQLVNHSKVPILAIPEK